MSAQPYSDEEIEAIRSLIGTIYEVDRYERSRICATVDTLRAQLDAARKALGEALDGWHDAAQYKGDYLREKHGDDEDVARLRAILKGGAA